MMRVDQRENDESEGMKSSRPAARRLQIAAAVVIVAYGLMLVIDLAAHPDKYQWDFSSYYYAGQAYIRGMNPYDLHVLSEVAGKEVGFPFAYSPVVLPLFALLARLNILTAYYLFLGLKLLCLGGLLYLWARRLLREEVDLLFYVLVLFGFGGAVYVDLAAGNISLLEQVGLWLAFYALLKDRPLAFSGLVVLVSLVKLSPILFLVLLPLVGGRRRLTALGGAFLAFVGINAVTWFLAPALYRDFLAVIPQLDDRGIINPSTLALFRDLADILTRNGIALSPVMPGVAYLAFAAAVALVTGLALRRVQGEDRRVTIFIVCLAFVLVAPRFKNYSYVLALVPAFYLVKRWIRLEASWAALLLVVISNRIPVPFGLGATAQNLFWGYYSLLLTLLLWALSVWVAIRNSADRVRSDPLPGAVPDAGAGRALRRPRSGA